MTAITDANTFIDQNLINVPYQGVPATTLNACLKTITNVFNSYATIASVNSLFGYALDGNFPAALMNAPNQAFTLNGGYVSISALLLFSSGQKYTVGPDGNYILNSVNSPAWDWSTGRRRLLIEGIGTTNMVPDARRLSTGWTVRGTASKTLNSAVAPDGTTTATLISGLDTVPAGDTFVYFVATTGARYEPSIFIKRVSTSGILDLRNPVGAGSWHIDMASLGSGWQRITRSHPAVTVVDEFVGDSSLCGVHLAKYSGSGTLSAYFWTAQMEPGTVSSSPIPCDTPTSRAADVVTAASGLLALLTAANATLVIRGTSLNGDGNTAQLVGSGNTYSTVSGWGASGGVNAVYMWDALGDFIGLAPISPASFNIGTGVSYTAGKTTIAANGSAASSCNKSLFTSSDTSIWFSKSGQNLVGAGNMLFDELIVWPIFASDAGLQAQARVYS